MTNNILSVRSTKDLEQVAADLETAVPNHRFGIIAKHNLTATMAKKGVELGRECLIFEVCNPHQAKTVLEADMEISTALPCRLSVYRDGDETVISTIRPSALFEFFHADGAEAAAAEVESAMEAIMSEAASVA